MKWKQKNCLFTIIFLCEKEDEYRGYANLSPQTYVHTKIQITYNAKHSLVN